MGRRKGWWDGGTVGTGGRGGSGHCSVAVAVVIIFLFGSDSDVLMRALVRWLAGIVLTEGANVSKQIKPD